MYTVTSFQGSAFGRDQLRAILADILQLERLHAVRQSRLRISGLLTTVVLALTFDRLPPWVLIAIVVAGLAAPGLAWGEEMRCRRRIERRLEQEKVVKSS